ncbi:hypothetical protein [Streptomyces anulatus]|uniref:hypothetical protein n=1 Tax=Streptomyces anulatus TaxID=1892 RepID=UPI00386A736D|nr:hypothetical protein OG865_27975 [Streptomyces anulatus]
MSDTTATESTGPPGPGATAKWLLTAEFLDTCIQRAGGSFQQGELAYLTMTSQVENPIRDRVAFEMHKQLRHSRMDVGRELTGLFTRGEHGQFAPRKIDLAVVEKPRRRRTYTPEPHGVVEFKAIYAHDARSPGEQNNVYRSVYTDVEKCAEWSSLVFSVVLLPTLRLVGDRHPSQIMEKIEGKVFADGSKRNMRLVSDEVTMQEVTKSLSRLGPVRKGLLDAGTDSGVQVAMPYLILGPVPVETYEVLDLLRLPPKQRGQSS